MGKKSRLKRERLVVGEIVEVRGRRGLLPPVTFKVEGVESDLIFGSIGEIRWGVNSKLIEVVRRRMPEPRSWLPFEIDFLRQHVARCDCADCREILETKELEFSRVGRSVTVEYELIVQ